MEIPSKKKLRAQRIFSVSEAELFWNKNGDRLAAHTERYQKKNIKTSASGSIEEIKYTVGQYSYRLVLIQCVCRLVLI